MGLKDSVLSELIKAENFVSGEQLAEKFGKSRAAVWKAIKALEKEDYKIDAVTNKGYYLADNNILSKPAIEAGLEHNEIEVVYYSKTDSTNNRAKQILAEGKGGTFLVVANEQTAGRGRQGKSFYSPENTGIYMSLVIHPNTNMQNAVTATTAAAVAVCRAIEAMTDIKPEIKWVNDVYVNGEKICGILTEAVFDFETETVSGVVIGIGVNVTTSEFPKGVENAGALNANINRAKFVAKIADELFEIAMNDYGTFIDYYRSHSMIIGKKIKFIQNDVETFATALEIDDTGGLVVKTDDGKTQTLRTGEVTVRRV